MRRIFAMALLAVFVSQSAGVALAADTAPPTLRINLAASIEAAQAAIMSSWLVAQVSGQGAEWTALHAPLVVKMPARNGPELQRLRSAVRSMGAPKLAQARFRTGVPQHVVLPKAPPRGIMRDARAIGQRDIAPGLLRPLGGLLHPTTQGAHATAQATSVLMHGLGGGPAAAERGQSAMVMQPNAVAATDTGAGIKPWWKFASYPDQGIGAALVNGDTGNLVVQATDFDIPEPGLDLAFARTYNSQSLEDVNGDDGGQAALYGDGWTNTYDLHLIYRAAQNVISVYDQTGARYDFTANGNGGWTPPAGAIGTTLEPASSTGCYYWWIQKSGIAYYFRAPRGLSPSCDSPTGGPGVATDGLLHEIVGRNANDSITLTYFFTSSSPTSTQDLTKIVVAHSNGQQLTMNFAMFGAHNGLASITLPDNATTWYYGLYSDGVLGSVWKPDNGSAAAYSSALQAHGVTPGHLPEIYGDQASVFYACGPRAEIGFWTNANQGGCPFFSFDASNRATDVYQSGVYNFTPADGTSTPLQGQANNGVWVAGRHSVFIYNPTYTQLWDSEGHSAVWYFDPSGHDVGVAQWSGIEWLFRYFTWDGTTGNLLSSSSITNSTGTPVTTTYGYDGNGNVVEIVQPQTSVTLGGTSTMLQPTTYISYDANDNVTAYCDRTDVGANGGYRTPSDALCGGGHGATTYVYTTDPNEARGCLTSSTSPIGYVRTIAYSGGGCGDGQPWTVTGQMLSDTLLNGNAVQPQVTTLYDAFGRVESVNNGRGTTSYTYDALNRATSVTDPDGITSHTCYNPDGSVRVSQSALQYSYDQTLCGASSYNYVYNPDGNEDSETHSGITTHKWYDGLDRLVEVEQPTDANIDYGKPGYTRYLYDLTSGGTQTVGTISGVVAWGNLYKTQRCLYAGSYATSCAWTDVSGNAYDGLGRVIARYQPTPTTAATGVATSNPQPGVAGGPWETWTNAYDGRGMEGLLFSTTDPAGVMTTFGYDTIDRVIAKSFTDGTPQDIYTRDPDGRITSASNQVASDTYTYDAAGDLLSDTEGGNLAAPASFTYTYYPNGWRSSTVIQDPAAGFLKTLTYDYDQDGLRNKLVVGQMPTPFTWTYDAAGKVLDQTDPYTGSGPLSSTPTATQPGYYAGGVTLGPQVATYNGTTGVLQSMTMPDGVSYTGFTYDALGYAAGFNVSARNFAYAANTALSRQTYPTAVQYGYDVRNELTTSSAASPASGGMALLSTTQFLAGHTFCATAGQIGCTSAAIVDQATGAASRLATVSGTCNSTGEISYDADGRQASEITLVNGGSGCPTAYHLSDTRAYDAENHTIGETSPTSFSTATYGYGPAGELRTWNSVTQGATNGTYTLHWNGGDLALVTLGSTVVQYNLEKLGTQFRANGSTGGTLSPLEVEDRDFAGTAIETHTGTGDSGANVTPNYYALNRLGSYGIPSVTGSYPASGQVPQTLYGFPLVQMTRTDGYTLGGGALSFQGARVYDSGTQQWTTPDAYKGNADDPSTQMAYEWNGNNPIANQDPTGHCDSFLSCGGGIAIGVAGFALVGIFAAAFLPEALLGVGVVEISLVGADVIGGVLGADGLAPAVESVPGLSNLMDALTVRVPPGTEVPVMVAQQVIGTLFGETASQSIDEATAGTGLPGASISWRTACGGVYSDAEACASYPNLPMDTLQYQLGDSAWQSEASIFGTDYTAWASGNADTGAENWF